MKLWNNPVLMVVKLQDVRKPSIRKKIGAEEGADIVEVVKD